MLASSWRRLTMHSFMVDGFVRSSKQPLDPQGAGPMTARPSTPTRRDFLKAGAALAAATALPRWFIEETAACAAAEEPKSPNDRPGILLVGCGGMGTGDANNATRFGNI